jgi:hypothetical protein
VSITLTDGSSTVTLPNEMLWLDEFSWSPTAAAETRTLAGTLVRQSASRDGGRPITLAGGWTTRETIKDLWDWAAADTALTLTLHDGRSFSVKFAADREPLSARPVIAYHTPADDDDYELEALNLRQEAS